MIETDVEWLTSTDPQAMLMWLQVNRKPTDRKLRLFAVSCCRRIWHLLKDERCNKAVEVAERFADGGADRSELEAAQVAVEQVPSAVDPRWGAAWGVTCEEALQAAWESLREATGWGDTCQAERREEVPFLRDIFGNPFRPVAIDPSWLTPNIVKSAHSIYDQRTFALMPQLANALKQAGCTSDDILQHCRQQCGHVRGCWVVDLILRKK